MQRGPAAALVRSRDTPLCANQPRLTHSDVDCPTLSTPRLQHVQTVLSELLLLGEERIFTCLAILRSIEPGYRYQEGPGGISRRQFDALSTLRDYGDSDISACLASNRLSNGGGRQPTSTLTHDSVTSNPSTVTASGHLRQPSTNSSLRSSTSSLAPSAVFSNNSSYGTPRSSFGNDISLPELPEELHCHEEAAHAHWCTYGEHQKQINTCEGWKRHEREHEVPYLCMPNGPVEYTEQGAKCALCFEEDPDIEHLARHHVSICVGKFGEPLKKSRKTDMVAHLAKHRIHSKDAAALAEQWRYPLNKKYFSCGLCVGIFYSITERFNHIDNEHWKHGQNMDAWELSNCIKGLLLEPRLQAAWRLLLRSVPTIVESNLRWEKPFAEGLQLRLEKAEESPQTLAKMALEFSNWAQTRPGQRGMGAATCRDRTIFSPVPPSSRILAATMASRSSNSANQPQVGYTQARIMFSQTQPGLLPPENIEASSTDYPNPLYERSTTPSALLNGFLEPDGFNNNTLWQQGSLMDLDLDVNDNPPQLPLTALPADWSSLDTNHILDDSPRIREHLVESGVLLLSQISPPPPPPPPPTASRNAPQPSAANETLSSSTSNRQTSQQNTNPHSHRNDNDVNRSNSARHHLPTSSYFHGSMMALQQQSGQGDCGSFLNKPLPPEPPL